MLLEILRQRIESTAEKAFLTKKQCFKKKNQCHLWLHLRVPQENFPHFIWLKVEFKL